MAAMATDGRDTLPQIRRTTVLDVPVHACGDAFAAAGP